MDLGRLKDVVRDAALINIRFYASVVDLSRDLLQSLKQAIEEDDKAPTALARNASPATEPVPPLVLAARAGERAESTFAIVNNLQLPVSATVEIAGDIDRAKVRVSPQSKMLAPGEECAVHISVDIDEAIEVGRDLHATISIPGLASRSIPFIVRRLPGAASPTRATKPVPAAPASPTPAGLARVRNAPKKSRKRASA